MSTTEMLVDSSGSSLRAKLGRGRKPLREKPGKLCSKPVILTFPGDIEDTCGSPTRPLWGPASPSIHSHCRSSFSHLASSFFFFFNFFNVYLLLKERENMSGGGAEKERETQNPKEATGSELTAQSPTQGSNPPTMRGHNLSRSQQLT